MYDAPIESLTKFLLNNLDDQIDLTLLSQISGRSPFALCRLFRKEYDTSPMKYVWDLRLYYAAGLIRNDLREKLSVVAKNAGFKSSAHFSRAFRQKFLMSPYNYKSRRYFIHKMKPVDYYLVDYFREDKLSLDLAVSDRF